MASTIKNPFLDFDPAKFFDPSKFFDVSRFSEMQKGFGDFQKVFTDFQKNFGDMKLLSPDFEGLLATQRRNVEAVVAANQLTIEGYQTIARRQAEILRQSFEEASAVMKELVSAGTPEDKVAKQAELVKVSFEKAVANMKELTELVAKSNTEAAEVLSKRVKESIEELQTALSKLSHKGS